MVLPVPLHVAFEYLDEGLAEGLVEEGVEEGVDHGGGVPEPRDEVDHALTHLHVTRDKDVDDEEGSPTQHEGEEDHTQHLVEGKTLDGNMQWKRMNGKRKENMMTSCDAVKRNEHKEN